MRLSAVYELHLIACQPFCTCAFIMLKQLLISSIICSPALCDEPAGRVRRGSAGGDGDVHVSSCWSANAYHQLETQLGTHSTQQQVGLMFFFYILLSSPGGNRKFSPTVSFVERACVALFGQAVSNKTSGESNSCSVDRQQTARI